MYRLQIPCSTSQCSSLSLSFSSHYHPVLFHRVCLLPLQFSPQTLIKLLLNVVNFNMLQVIEFTAHVRWGNSELTSLKNPAIEKDTTSKEKKKNKEDCQRGLLHPPAFCNPSRVCWPGLMTKLVGATVYLKYLQKSNKAFRLNRDASASSRRNTDIITKAWAWGIIKVCYLQKQAYAH